MFNIDPVFYNVNAYNQLCEAAKNAAPQHTQAVSDEPASAYNNASRFQYPQPQAPHPATRMAATPGYGNLDPVFYNVNAYNQLCEAAKNAAPQHTQAVSDEPASAYNSASRFQYPQPQAPHPATRMAAMPDYGNLSHLAQGFVVVIQPPLSSFSSYGPTSSAPSHSPSLGFDPGRGMEQGCVLSCIATVAGVSYEKARAEAADLVGFHTYSPGLRLKDAKKILNSLGVTSSRHRQKGVDWKDLPDLAIVSVGTSSTRHAVVFERNGNNEYIYDRNNYGPVPRLSNYQLLNDDFYLKIDRNS